MLAVAASTPCMGFIPLAPPTVFYTPLAPPASSRASAHLMEMKMGENSQKLQPWWKRRPTGRPTGTLILLRHGETAVPRGTSFLGWSDADLNQMGEQGTAEAAQAIRQAGYSFDVAYTSVLKRAVRTTWLLLQELDKIYLPVWKNWRLNERCYGALTAEPVDELQRKYGDDKVASFRRSFDQRPPPFEPNSQHNPANDPRYERWQDRKGKIRQVSLPNGESLLDVCERVTPVWKREILPDLRRGRSVLVVAHGNSIRAIVQAIDDLSDEDMADIEIPPCIPLVYRFERKGAIESLAEGAAEGAIASARLAGLLATVRRQIRDDVADALRRRLRGGKERARDYDIVPVVTDASAAPLSGEFLATSSKLIAAQDRMRAASMARYGIGEASAENQLEQNAGTYGAFMTPANSADAVAGYEPTLASTMPMRAPPLISSGPPPPPEAMIALPGGGAMVSKGREKRQQHVVIIRHGKTEHNKLGLFTGWEDVSLAKEGRAEAMAAGKMLARHGFKFDVVYTSWLSRAIETAWLVLVELDAMWLPIHKSWRLNERMYGALTGLSKKKTRTIYGETQFKKWRRGYSIRPPPASSFSQHYPGNDQRYVDNVIDVRWSAKESLIRSLESGRVRLHRKLPRTESLKDCMDRTIPYYVNSIEGEAIAAGKSVLVASSENAIRGLLMHLLKIPQDRISDIEIPTGLPLVFDMRHRCLRLVEGDFSDYNFGKAAELLFTQCEIPDEDYDELDLSEVAAEPSSSTTISA